MSSAAASNKNGEAPIHVLMALPPAAADNGSSRRWELNPRLQRDYVARRNKANGGATPLHLWTGVSETERALVYCCEARDEARDEEFLATATTTTTTTHGALGKRGNDPEYPLMGGGALDMEQEMRFVGILATDCHSMASRALALAILERTLETHLWELEESQQRLRANRPEEGEDEGDDHEKEEEKQEEPEDGDEEEDEDDEIKPGQKRRSRRLRKQEPKYKRTNRKEESPEGSSSKQDQPMFDYEKWSRLEQFFAAGGLKILNRWLFEAYEDEVVLQPKLPSAEKTGSSKMRPAKQATKEEPKLQASSTRTLILPILRFLERIPFDKKLVVDSKINKQIKLIEKQVNGILDTRARGKHSPEDLENWTTEPTTSETEPLDLVKEAVDQVKKAWGEKAKKEKKTFGNPFDLLSETLHERLGAVVEFESGSAPQPEWIEFPDDAKRKAKKSRSELAAKERATERKIRQNLGEDLQRRLREAEKKHREHLALMREKRKWQETSKVQALDFKKSSGGRQVQWKDGMKSKSVRNRKILEEVFVFHKNKPSNPEVEDMTEEEDVQDGTPEVITTTADEPESSGVGADDMESDGLIDLSLL